MQVECSVSVSVYYAACHQSLKCVGARACVVMRYSSIVVELLSLSLTADAPSSWIGVKRIGATANRSDWRGNVDAARTTVNEI